MTKDEALKLAMKAMEITGGFDVEITAIKKALAQPEPWEKFCDSYCVWTDHHPDCKLAERLPLTDEEERKAFEQWYVCNAFDYERNPIGSRECGLQWSAWKARAAHGIKE